MSKESKNLEYELSRTATKFMKMYYSTFDKCRNKMHCFYIESGLSVWNGEGAHGKDGIQKLLDDLPNSEHDLTKVYDQPIAGEAVAGQLTYIVQAVGFARYSGQNRKPFMQDFIITADAGNWKIVNDAYILQEDPALVDSKKSDENK